MAETPRKHRTPFFAPRNSWLPAERRPLTPPARHCLEIGNSPRSQFFTKLPQEIRTQIYRCAFGDRIIHMDLHICCSESCSQGGTCDATRARVREPLSNEVRCRGWYWRGNVCNQPLQIHRGSNVWFHSDGGNCFAEKNTPSKVTEIGAISWLLSCRQAYVTPD